MTVCGLYNLGWTMPTLETVFHSLALSYRIIFQKNPTPLGHTLT
jgi:hypothetical protein